MIKDVLQAIYQDGTQWSDIQRDSYLPETPKIPSELEQVDSQVWGALFAIDPTNRDTFAHPVRVWDELKQNAWAAGYQACADMSQAKDFFGNTDPVAFQGKLEYIEGLLEGK